MVVYIMIGIALLVLGYCAGKRDGKLETQEKVARLMAREELDRLKMAAIEMDRITAELERLKKIEVEYNKLKGK